MQTLQGAVRLGDWKLIEWFEDGRLELYHLATDPGERTNLADREAVRVRELHDLLVAWRAEMDAKMPVPRTRDESERR